MRTRKKVGRGSSRGGGRSRIRVRRTGKSRRMRVMRTRKKLGRGSSRRGGKKRIRVMRTGKSQGG